MIYKNTG